MKKLLLIICTSVLFVSCSSTDDQAIQGIEHADLYLNLKDNGFTDESIVTENGVSHVNKKESFGVQYSVISNGTSKYLYTYTASVVADHDLSKNTEAPQFLQFVSSLPYDGVNPSEVQQWVVDNYNEKSKDLIVNGVKFELKAPTPQVRMLVVSKV